MWVHVRTNEYPQSMFWTKNKKKYAYPYIPQFCYTKGGFKGVYITWICFLDGDILGSNFTGTKSYRNILEQEASNRTQLNTQEAVAVSPHD